MRFSWAHVAGWVIAAALCAAFPPTLVIVLCLVIWWVLRSARMEIEAEAATPPQPPQPTLPLPQVREPERKIYSRGFQNSTR